MWRWLLVAVGLAPGLVPSIALDEDGHLHPEAQRSDGALDLDPKESPGAGKSSSLPKALSRCGESLVATDGKGYDPRVLADTGKGGSNRQVPGQTQCFSMAEYLGAVLSALRSSWSREGEERRQASLALFGICSGTDVSTDPRFKALTALASIQDGESRGPWALHLDKELWTPGTEAGSISLTFEVPQVFEASTYLSSEAPTVLLFFVTSQTTEVLEVAFSSTALQPNQQKACIGEGTHYIILTMQPFEAGKLPQTVQMTVNIKGPNKGSTWSLLEVQELFMRADEKDNKQKRAFLIFLPNKSTKEMEGGAKANADDGAVSPVQPPPSRTYQFLCQLQRFLSSSLPPREPAPRPGGDHNLAAITLSSLSSLPRLVLDLSSSEGLLLGLINSSTPMLFSFPRRGAELLGHQVALTLQPPLLAMLHEQLAEALAQFRSHEVEKSLTDVLQRLCEFCSLPAEGTAQTEGGNGEASEDQYHALLLLKALQTVLGAWEAERAQRAARGGEEGPGLPKPCHLQSLVVSLEDFFMEPTEAAINNCAGKCGFPLTNGNNHAILLNTMAQREGWSGRAPCCVPTEYGDLLVLELDSKGSTVLAKTNMVAKKCGCR